MRVVLIIFGTLIMGTVLSALTGYLIWKNTNSIPLTLIVCGVTALGCGFIGSLILENII
jgi:F0F1-type ATP synthase assembly protein I